MLPDKAQQAIGQVKAAYALSQALSGFIEGGWNADELEDLGQQIELNRIHFVRYLRETRGLVAEHEALAGQVVDLTEAAVRGVDGLDRVHFINAVIQDLELNSGGADVGDELARLRGLRDETIIYLPGGEWGTEPVLYSRLYEVTNAAARVRELYDDRLRAKHPELWESMSRSRMERALVGLQRAIGAGKAGKKIEPAKPGTLKPKNGGPSPGGAIPLPDGGTATAPDGPDGPVAMPDGSLVYIYRPGGSVLRTILLPAADGARRATVTELTNGVTIVVQADGTRVVHAPANGAATVTHPDGTVVRSQTGGATVVEAAATGEREVISDGASESFVVDSFFDVFVGVPVGGAGL